MIEDFEALTDLLEMDSITMTDRPSDAPSSSDDWPGSVWHQCTLRREGFKYPFTVPFGVGAGRRDEVPEMAEVVYGLLGEVTLTDDMTYREWLAEYDFPDDAKRRNRWRTGQSQTVKLKRLLGNEFDAYMEYVRYK
jgi:hypothetical protein